MRKVGLWEPEATPAAAASLHLRPHLTPRAAHVCGCGRGRGRLAHTMAWVGGS